MEITQECWHRNNLESHIAVTYAFDTSMNEKKKNAELDHFSFENVTPRIHNAAEYTSSV